LKILKFSTDGAGGEFIETIKVTLQRYKEEIANGFLKHGTLNSINITTNRKQSFHAGALSDDATLKPVAIAPGSTLTGLYASHNPESGLISLGAISEVIGTRGRWLNEGLTRHARWTFEPDLGSIVMRHCRRCAATGC
jgi:hypothetical protein